MIGHWALGTKIARYLILICVTKRHNFTTFVLIFSHTALKYNDFCTPPPNIYFKQLTCTALQDLVSNTKVYK